MLLPGKPGLATECPECSGPPHKSSIPEIKSDLRATWADLLREQGKSDAEVEKLISDADWLKKLAEEDWVKELAGEDRVKKLKKLSERNSTKINETAETKTVNKAKLYYFTWAYVKLQDEQILSPICPIHPEAPVHLKPSEPSGDDLVVLCGTADHHLINMCPKLAFDAEKQEAAKLLDRLPPEN